MARIVATTNRGIGVLGVKMRAQARRIKQLESALKPFAEFADRLDPQDFRDRNQMFFGASAEFARPCEELYLDDCATAAKVLKKEKPDA